MHDRSKSATFQTYSQYPQSRSEYIKILGQDVDDRQGGFSQQAIREDGQTVKRFTFNQEYQDAINEEEDEQDNEFVKIDCQQFFQLERQVGSLKAENLRLVQESTENIQLFNAFMKEMEQRAFENSQEINNLRARIRLLEERCESSEDRANKAELKLLTDPIKSLNKRDCAVQSEEKTYRLFNTLQKKRYERKEKFDSKDVHISKLQTDNLQMQKQITQLKESHQNLTQSFEKQIKLQKVKQDYNNMPSAYYQTLTNSPRASLSKQTSSDAFRFNFATSSFLNALLSPRTNPNSTSQHQNNFEPHFGTGSHYQDSFVGKQGKTERTMWKSRCRESELQFERAEVRIGTKRVK